MRNEDHLHRKPKRRGWQETTALNLGAGLAAFGRQVLLIGLDPQASLTMAIVHEASERSMADVMGDTTPGKLRLVDIIKPMNSGLDLATSDHPLSNSELGFNVRPKREAILQRVLAQGSGYDLALLDCRPRVGLLLVNALTASHAVISPTPPDLAGLPQRAALPAEPGYDPGKRAEPGPAAAGRAGLKV